MEGGLNIVQNEGPINYTFWQEDQESPPAAQGAHDRFWGSR
jgi:hypothetical protein